MNLNQAMYIKEDQRPPPVTPLLHLTVTQLKALVAMMVGSQGRCPLGLINEMRSVPG